MSRKKGRNMELSAKDIEKANKFCASLPDPYFDEEEEQEQTPTPKIDHAEEEKRILAYFAKQEQLKREREQGIFKGLQLPLKSEQVKALDPNDRCELRRWEQHWTNVPWPKVNKPTERQILEAALGNVPCPACGDKIFFPGILYGQDTGLWERKAHIDCWCAIYRLVQQRVDEVVGKRYRAMDFRTVQPSAKNNLDPERQTQEYADCQAHKDMNFLFAGSAGTGKTTTCAMLAREAIWRHRDYLWESRHHVNPVRWVWKTDAENLFQQFADWSTSRLSDNPKPEPVVSPRKVEKAISLGLKPTIILEELDKTHMTMSRFTFLYDIVNAMYEGEGQFIVTTNRTIPRFIALFAEHDLETVRTSGEPMIRRWLETCHKKEYFV